jgi:hypothetical protein
MRAHSRPNVSREDRALMEARSPAYSGRCSRSAAKDGKASRQGALRRAHLSKRRARRIPTRWRVFRCRSRRHSRAHDSPALANSLAHRNKAPCKSRASRRSRRIARRAKASRVQSLPALYPCCVCRPSRVLIRARTVKVILTPNPPASTKVNEGAQSHVVTGEQIANSRVDSRLPRWRRTERPARAERYTPPHSSMRTPSTVARMRWIIATTVSSSLTSKRRYQVKSVEPGCPTMKRSSSSLARTRAPSVFHSSTSCFRAQSTALPRRARRRSRPSHPPARRRRVRRRRARRVRRPGPRKVVPRRVDRGLAGRNAFP